MTEMRWVLTREQVMGTFSEPVERSDGSTVFARLQYREQRQGLVESSAAWLDIPVVSEITEQPKIALVKGHGRPN